MEDYQKYKWFFTSGKTLVIGGKSASQNDEMIRALKAAKKDYVMMHTAMPGSPFSCIVKDISRVSSQDKEECAVFTACFSKAWKSHAKRVVVHEFNLSQLSKTSSMKSGTWGVKGEIKMHIVPDMRLYLTRQHSILRAVPFQPTKKDSMIVVPGNIDKNDILAKLEIECNEPLSKEEVLAALPAGGLAIRKK